METTKTNLIQFLQGLQELFEKTYVESIVIESCEKCTVISIGIKTKQFNNDIYKFILPHSESCIDSLMLEENINGLTKGDNNND